MSAPYTGMRRKIENCVMNYVRSTYDFPTGTNAYKSMEVISGDGLVAPYVSVICTGTVPWNEALGPLQAATNRTANVVITIATPAQDKTDGGMTVETCSERHEFTVGSIMDAFYRSDIVAALNAIGEPGIAVDQYDMPSEDMRPENGVYVTQLNMAIVIHATGD